MGTIPVTPNIIAGTIGMAAQMNQICDAIDFWALPPRCRAYLNAAGTSTTTSVYLPIPLDAESYDIPQPGDSPMHDVATNNTRIYARTTGKYEIVAQIQFATSATGYRSIMSRINAAGNPAGGTQIAVSNQDPLTGVATVVGALPEEASLNAGDYVELFGWQNTGGALGINQGINATFLRMTLIAA